MPPFDGDVKQVVEELGQAWSDFKTKHEQELKEIKAGIKAAPADLKKVEDALDKLEAKKVQLEREAAAEKRRLDEIEAKLNRPQLGNGADANAEAKAIEAFNVERKSTYAAAGKPTPGDVSADEYRAYKTAFVDYLRKGTLETASDAERKNMATGSDPAGGYLVPTEMSGRIVTRVFDFSPIRQIASVETISTDSIEITVDIDEASDGWVEELTARADTTAPTLRAMNIPAKELYAQPRASQRLLDDSRVDIEAWLSRKIADRFARREGAAFVGGNGTVQPRGFTTYTTAATADATRAWATLEHVSTGVNSAFAASNPADTLYDLEAAFKPQYLANASWVTRRSVIQAIRKFKDGQGQYLWQPGLQAGRPAQLIGYPIVMAEDMPALAAGSLSLALGDFREGYQIVDRAGIRTLRDPFTDKPRVRFYSIRRVGGAVANFEAIKFVRFGT
jgi:HK97 family phage major capsid protein